MKRALIFLLAICCAAVLSGCGALGFDDYGKYTQAAADHSTAESDRIQAQSAAIVDATRSAGATENEKLLLAVIAMLQVERLHPVPFNAVPPVTGMNVLNNLVDKGPVLVGFGAMAWTAKELGQLIGGTNLTAETMSISDSFNPVEAHATGSSNSLSMSIPYKTVTDNSASTGVTP